MFVLKLPFGDLWFAGLSDEGDLIFGPRERAIALPTREAFADYLLEGVGLSIFVVVPA